MSAIWGIVTLEETEKLPSGVQELFETAYETYKIDRLEGRQTDRAYFGCGLQYITAEAKKECLPLEEKDILFTADCILDNREEVIQKLAESAAEQENLRKMPDGTLLFQAYLRFGTACAEMLRGLYTMAIWSGKENRLTLLSDPVSARCLYYIRQGNTVAFSTVLKPLLPLLPLLPEIQSNVNYYKDFLLVNPSVIYVMPGETPYKDIYLMTPSMKAEFKKEGTHLQEYVSYGAAEGKRLGKGKKACSKAFVELYRQCVRDALRCDGEVGIAMSSGLDSSSIGVLAAQELAQKGKNLHSYTFVPYQMTGASEAGDRIYDESGYVKELAEKYPNIEVKVLNNQGQNMFFDRKESTEILELPYKTGTFPNHLEMCREGAKVGCKVFLNGGFGNNTVSYGEINHILFDCYQRKRYLRLLLWLNRYCRHENIGRKKTFFSLWNNYGKEEKKMPELSANFRPDNFFVCPEILREYDIKARFETDKRLLLGEHYIDRIKYRSHLKATALLTYLGVFETKFGLETGMVLRDPTKDIRMIRFCEALPYERFAWGGMARWLIRYGFRELLPKSFLERWSKKGALNADWLDRVYRDWDKIKPYLEESLQDESIAEWINGEQIRANLETIGTDKVADSRVLTHLCALDAVVRHCKKK